MPAAGRHEVRGIDIVLTGNADEGEQSIAAGISERRSHAMGGGGIGNGADRPVRGDPLPRCMRQYRR